MASELIVIGSSLGGLHAMQTVLSALPRSFPVPIVAVQHRSKDSESSLSAILQKTCTLTVREAEDKDAIAPGNVYLAPPDYHLLVDGRSLALSTEDSVARSRPSIDVLFASAAEAYGTSLVGVILTGASHDGTAGLLRLKEMGGTAIVQDPMTAESSRMPASAIASVAVDAILPLDKISGALVALAGGPLEEHAP